MTPRETPRARPFQRSRWRPARRCAYRSSSGQGARAGAPMIGGISSAEAIDAVGGHLGCGARARRAPWRRLRISFHHQRREKVMRMRRALWLAVPLVVIVLGGVGLFAACAKSGDWTSVFTV